MNEEKVEAAVLAYLSADNEDEFGPRRSFSTIFDKIVGPSVPRVDGFDEDDELHMKQELEAILNKMVADDLLNSAWGERDVEASYRLTDQGIYEASGFDVLATESGDPLLTENGEYIEVENLPPQSTDVEGDEPIQKKSEDWTGPKLVLTDAKVIRQIRIQASELRELVHSIRFESNSDSQDIKALADALVAVCSMAEPELSIIDRILSHPKFQLTAGLIAAVATIRSALGI